MGKTLTNSIWLWASDFIPSFILCVGRLKKSSNKEDYLGLKCITSNSHTIKLTSLTKYNDNLYVSCTESNK